jgi:hypothetical protein
VKETKGNSLKLDWWGGKKSFKTERFPDELQSFLVNFRAF